MTSAPAKDHALLGLTGAQGGFWYAQQLAPRSPAYNTGEYLEIHGPVDTDLFETALRRTVAEAEAFGLRFVDTAEGPRCTPAPTADWVLHMRDVSAAPDPTAAAEEWMRADRATAVPVSEGPLFTHALFKAADDRYLWYMRAHHILLDGYGYLLVFRRAAEIYSALASRQEVPGTAFAPVRTLLDEEAAYRASDRYERDRAYWTERFAGHSGAVTLAEGTAPPSPAFLRRTAALSASAAERLSAAASAVGASRTELLLAAVAMYTHRVTACEDVILGVTTMSRLGSAALRTPGTVSNNLPLRLSVRPDTGAGELISAATAELRAVRRHQQYRGEDLRRDVKLLGGDRRLFGPLVNLVPFSHRLRFDGHPATPHHLSGGAVDDLLITVRPGVDDTGLGFAFDANPALYTEDVLAGHLERFLTLLDQLADAEPGLTVAGANLLLPGEDPAYASPEPVPAAADATVPARFEARAAEAPEATAVTHDGHALSYAELNARANRLARLLVARGAGPGRTVAVALTRSADLVTGQLAVLKSGAACLPLDPAHPAGRLRAQADDAAPALVLTDVSAAGALSGTDIPAVVLGAPATDGELAAHSAANLSDIDRGAPLTPDAVAYVFPTPTATPDATGSTKGVLVPHGDLTGLFEAAAAHVPYGPDDSWALFHSCASHVGVWEVWGALLHGGRLVVVDHDTARSPEELLDLLRRERVTVLNQSSAALPALVRADQEAAPGSGPGTPRLALRHLVIAGEAPPPADLSPWIERYGDEAPVLVTMYGDAETTGPVAFQRVNRDLIGQGRRVLGTPLPDARLYVLDHGRRPVPPGWVGELYVAGARLARTTEPGDQRFVADPFGRPGERMYRTGDLVRRCADGTPEYVGRTDEQVRTGGFRVEPAEIETALLRHPAVAQAAVVARDGHDTGSRVLVAHAVPGPGRRPTRAELLAHLAQVLPEHMVPGACVLVDALPLTADGTPDRKALAAADAGAPGSAAATGAEAQVCRLFEEVLGLPAGAVGPDDDFFDLGGQSLLASRLRTRLRAVTGAEVSLRTLFTEPTPGRIAARLSVPPATAAPARPALVPTERGDRIALSSAQQGMWFLNQLDTTAATYNMPLVVRLERPVVDEALRAALSDVVDRHESLRTLLPQADGTPYQDIRAPGTVRPDLEVVDCPAQEVEAYVAAARRRPFDLTRDIPLWAGLYGPGDGTRGLVLLLHHSAADGWSLVPFAKDLSTAYAARLEGRAPDWAAPTIQYADYTLWQEQLLDGLRDPAAPMGRQLAFWKEALAKLPEEIPLPADRGRPAVPGRRGRGLTIGVDSGLHRALLRLADADGASLFMVLQSALAALLTRCGAGDDIPIGTPVAGRADEALDDLIGVVTNTLVTRTDTSGDPAFRALLARVRTFDLAAYDHQDLPFDRLVEELNPARAAARHPLFQVMLALQNNTEAVLRLGGNEAPLHPTATGTAKFDLFVEFTERRGADATPDGLTCHVEYSTDLFDEVTVRRLADGLHETLAAVAAEPDLRISGLPDPGPLPSRATAADEPVDAQALERSVLAVGGIRECLVLPPQDGDAGRPTVLAVPTRAKAAGQAERALRRTAPDGRAPRVVAVSDLPRTADGALDTAASAQLPRIGTEQAERWQRALAEVPGVDAVTVELEWDTEPLGRLHAGPAASGPSERPGAAAEGSEAMASGSTVREAVPSVSEGPTLAEPTVRTWAEALRRAAAGGPHAEVVHVRADGSTVRRSYASLAEEASRVLGGLRGLGLRPGDQVILQCDDTEDFLAVLWGCILGGFVTVPLTVPASYAEDSAAVNKLDGVWRMLGRPWIVTSGGHEDGLRALADRRAWTESRLTTVDALRSGPADSEWHPARPGDLILMLLTSGSTGLPKAVELNHRNVLTRSAATAQVNGLTEDDVSLNWIPLDHVTGVVMFHLRDVFLGCRQVHAPTSWVLQDPLRWMDLADRHRVTVTWAPNFAFGLPVEHADRMGDRRWDLSPMRMVMNCGEVVVAATVRRFLQVLAPFGLPPTVVHPGWGMSETCSVVTDAVLSAEPAVGEDTFVSCGLPYPGFTMRVVDDQGRVVPEGTVGHFQVRGTSVTSGYHDNPAKNAESFTDDGWFDTGDLAFLRSGELYITGRAKDVIIINGVNHYSHEIEACVEELPFVERSFTAACAVRPDPAADTDELALFLHVLPGTDLADALRTVRGKVTREIGITPAHLVPVEPETIPKTEIGKIQRTQLRTRFEAGEFDEDVRRTEVLLGTAATVPDWFLRPVWQRAQGPHRTASPARHTLVLAGRDALGARVAEAVAGELWRGGALCTVVTAADEFRRVDLARYRVRVDRPGDYEALFAGLAADGRPVDAVIHLGALTAGGGEPERVEDLREAQRDGVDSLVCLARALSSSGNPDHSVSLHLVTGGTQDVLPEDRPSGLHAAAGGLLKSLREELPWLTACRLDLPVADDGEADRAEATQPDSPVADPAAAARPELPFTDPAAAARLILAEAGGPVTDAEVAYRNGQRWVRRLARLPDPLPRKRPAAADGFLLVSGGLGGVAALVAEHLLKAPGTRLLLVGRTELPPEHTWDTPAAQDGEAARRVEAYRRLRERGEVRYECADITDPAQVRAVVDKAAAAWSAPLAGVVHLAGAFDQRPVAEYDLEAWRAALDAKVTGCWVLHRLAEECSASSFLSFSSVNGFFGGSMTGAYAAANAFLDALAVYQHRRGGMAAHSLSWSMWDDIGMSRGYGLRALTEARGYRVLEHTAGLRSFDLARSLEEPHVLIGVDRNAPWVRGHLQGPARPVHRLAARVALRDGTDIGALHRAAEDSARLSGAADRWVLRAAGTASTGASPGGSAVRPADPDTDRRRALEDTLCGIWRRVLDRDQVGVDDSFFDLGGTSLLLVRAMTEVNRELGCDLTVVDLFSHPTVEALSRHLADRVPVPATADGPPSGDGSSAGVAADSGTAAPGGALARARQQAQRQRAARNRPIRQNKQNKGNDGDD
ncbi:SDR family oxidoreductase [Streptomyces europaeiscabiei]|uniref:SDR family oxidoreductase n=1 Tax=Streptomyces europaeiscabiei TaxID=146819 RepID=UPI0029AF7564|nr:SDR family oxidoreductase [Streptomyces europaeiscabiei]MDX3696460.1 SDR family oxidoreductase [Streptomyces europaeiscabiei]